MTPTLQMGIGGGSVGMRIVEPINNDWAVLSDWQKILTEHDSVDQREEHHVSIEARRMLGKNLYIRGGIVGMRTTHVDSGTNVYETGYGLNGGIGSKFQWGRVTGFVDYFGMGLLTNHWATFGKTPADVPDYFGPAISDYSKGQVFHGNALQVGLGVDF